MTAWSLSSAINFQAEPSHARACRKRGTFTCCSKEGKAIEPGSVERYLKSKFGGSLPNVQKAMEKLARSKKPEALAVQAYSLYEEFRPEIPAGTKGWGAQGELDLRKVESLAR